MTLERMEAYFRVVKNAASKHQCLSNRTKIRGVEVLNLLSKRYLYERNKKTTHLTSCSDTLRMKCFSISTVLRSANASNTYVALKRTCFCVLPYSVWSRRKTHKNHNSYKMISILRHAMCWGDCRHLKVTRLHKIDWEAESSTCQDFLGIPRRTIWNPDCK